jgi:transcriptional regulator with GAF, ATPase, and Fis domain
VIRPSAPLPTRAAKLSSDRDSGVYTTTPELRRAETAARPTIVGRSLAMRRLLGNVDRVARTPAGVLIRGETGTGKDAIAQRIHALSDRASGPFVVIDCSALSPSLAESELFGHERGAFTGAQNTRAGLFEEANGGTVFLDELGELPKELQPKLLRVLEQRMVRRVGSTRQIPIDVRVICATHRDLRAEVARGRFREDLYYRVAAITLEVPALRERLDDLPLLVEHFMQQDGSTLRPEMLPDSTWRALEQHAWPGNVRELRNVVQRLMITPAQPFEERRPLLAPANDLVAPELFARESWGAPAAPVAEVVRHSVRAPAPASDADLPRLRAARRECMSTFERDYLIRVLEATDHNVTRAAKVAGVSRQMIQRMMSKHRIRRAVSLTQPEYAGSDVLA